MAISAAGNHRLRLRVRRDRHEPGAVGRPSPAAESRSGNALAPHPCWTYAVAAAGARRPAHSHRQSHPAGPAETGPKQEENRTITGRKQERFPVFLDGESFCVNNLNCCRLLYLTGASPRAGRRRFVRSGRDIPQPFGSSGKFPTTVCPPIGRHRFVNIPDTKRPARSAAERGGGGSGIAPATPARRRGRAQLSQGSRLLPSPFRGRAPGGWGTSSRPAATPSPPRSRRWGRGGRGKAR